MKTVFYCAEDVVALTSLQDIELCPECGEPMEGIGFLEAAEEKS